MLNVSETFGPTIQGEGPGFGRVASFIRLQGCGVGCAWCDSKYTWDKGDDLDFLKSEDFLVTDALNRIPNGGTVVITGGEPLEQDIDPLLRKLSEKMDDAMTYNHMLSYGIEIETSGSIPPTKLMRELMYEVGLYANVSPKLSSAKAALGPQTIENIEAWYKAGAYLKFVVGSDEDIAEVEEISTSLHIPPAHISLMPCAVSRKQLEEKSSWLEKICKQKGYRMTFRLHLYLWGAKRGV